MNTGKFTAEKLTFTLFEGAGMLDLRLLALGTEAPDYLAGRSGFVGPGGWVDEPDETRGDDWCLIEGGARVLQGVSFTQRAPANLVAVCAAWKARPAPASKQDVAVVRAVLNEAALPTPALVPLWQVDGLVGIGCKGHRADELALAIKAAGEGGRLTRWGYGSPWLSKIVLAGVAGRPVAGAPVYTTGRRLVVENTDEETETIAAGGGRRAERLLERLRAGERVVRAVLSMAIDGPGGEWIVSWTAADDRAEEASGWTARPPAGMAGEEAGPGARLAVWRAWADAWRAALDALEAVTVAEMLAAGTEP